MIQKKKEPIIIKIASKEKQKACRKGKREKNPLKKVYKECSTKKIDKYYF